MVETSQAAANFQNIMIAANSNTVFNAMAYQAENRLVAYAASNTVLLLDPYHETTHAEAGGTQKSLKTPKVICSLNAHTTRVNAVGWLTKNLLVSIGGDELCIVVWESADPRRPDSWTVKQKIEGAHKGTLTQLTTYSTLVDDGGARENYFVTIDSEGTIKVWAGMTQADGVSSDFIEKAMLMFGRNLQETAALHVIGSNHLLLLTGGYDSQIHVYSTLRGSEESPLTYQFSMLGHFNSIKQLAFSPEIGKNSEDPDKREVYYLASCSQDQNIRIWKVQPLSNLAKQEETKVASEKEDQGEWTDQFKTKTSYVLSLPDEKVYNFTLESVLQHHQEAVSSVQWSVANTVLAEQRPLAIEDLNLLSSSFDFTVCIWQADPQTEAWAVKSTLGALVGNKHAYFGASFLEDTDQILAYTYGGAMHQWKRNKETLEWTPQVTVKGHFGEVTDLDWDEHELALVSTSSDQTTRIFAEHTVPQTWYEVGRPQVHGYDMNAVCAIKSNDHSGKCRLASRILSGGDEKVLRLFEAPYNYIRTMNSLNPSISDEQPASQFRFSTDHSNQEVETMIEQEAKKQPLGLMNKPAVLLANKGMRVDEKEEGGAGEEFDPVSVLSNKKKAQNLITVAEPPVEDVLMARTLWPEQQKLYGHVFEVFCVASSYKGDVAASACKALEAKYADIIIWDLNKNQTTVPSCRLNAHHKTVVQLEFSHDDQYLLSCGRDRQWAIFKRDQGESLSFKLIKKEKDAHARIIWGVSWSHDDQLFATGSREKPFGVKVWNGIKDKEEDIGQSHSMLPKQAVPDTTAIQFLPSLIREEYQILVGLDTGVIMNWALRKAGEKAEWVKIAQMPLYMQHFGAVRRIRVNVRSSAKEVEAREEGKEVWHTVATCSNDHSVRIFRLTQ